MRIKKNGEKLHWPEIQVDDLINSTAKTNTSIIKKVYPSEKEIVIELSNGILSTRVKTDEYNYTYHGTQYYRFSNGDRVIVNDSTPAKGYIGLIGTVQRSYENNESGVFIVFDAGIENYFLKTSVDLLSIKSTAPPPANPYSSLMSKLITEQTTEFKIGDKVKILSSVLYCEGEEGTVSTIDNFSKQALVTGVSRGSVWVYLSNLRLISQLNKTVNTNGYSKQEEQQRFSIGSTTSINLQRKNFTIKRGQKPKGHSISSGKRKAIITSR